MYKARGTNIVRKGAKVTEVSVALSRIFSEQVGITTCRRADTLDRSGSGELHLRLLSPPTISHLDMPVGIEAWVTQIPPITRGWLVLSVLMSLAVVSKSLLWHYLGLTDASVRGSNAN